MICLELDKIVMNLYRNVLQKFVSNFSSRGEMLCIYDKVDVLFCLCRIFVADKDTDNNFIISENELLKIERLVYTF
jgi:hypothetical protein